MIVGLSLGGVALIAALAVGGYLLFSGLNQTEEPPNNVAITTPVIENEPTDTPTVEDEPTDTNTTSDYELFVHDLIGISFELVDGWEPEESENYPDEVLGLYHDNPDFAFVWIDRFADIAYEDYIEDRDKMLRLYIDGLEGSLNSIITEENITLHGVSWLHITFTMTDKYGDLYIDYYVTDMPNGRGTFMYAIICPMDSPDQTVFPGYDQAYHMFYTLRFIK